VCAYRTGYTALPVVADNMPGLQLFAAKLRDFLSYTAAPHPTYKICINIGAIAASSK